MNFGEIRTDYRKGSLRRSSLDPDPIAQFNLWFADATKAGIPEPTAMTLASAGTDGQPRARTVLLKGLDERGFLFFTNLESRKAQEIAENPAVSLLFPWLVLERQVIVTGHASAASAGEAAAYFASRPRESQLAAWASHQSSAIPSREELEAQWEDIRSRFGEGEIPLPAFWGGYRVKPETVEFWQGGPNRLHDRFEYARETDGTWKITRLAP